MGVKKWMNLTFRGNWTILVALTFIYWIIYYIKEKKLYYEYYEYDKFWKLWQFYTPHKNPSISSLFINYFYFQFIIIIGCSLNLPPPLLHLFLSSKCRASSLFFSPPPSEACCTLNHFRRKPTSSSCWSDPCFYSFYFTLFSFSFWLFHNLQNHRYPTCSWH